MRPSPDARERRRGPPPWWPGGEPWPPRDRHALREARRARFARRSGWFSFLPFWGAIWVITWLLHGGAGDGAARSGPVLLVAALAAAAMALLVRVVAAPLADIVSAAERIGRRDYRVRVAEPAHGPAWIGDTARAFNAMAGELEAQDTARRQLMGDIAHELRTPLAVVQGTLEGVLDGVYERDDARLQGLLDDTRVIARLVEDLGTLATAESGAFALAREPVDVLALAHDVAAGFGPRASDLGVTLAVTSSAERDGEPVALDPVRIRQVLSNLVANALRVTPRGGRVTIAIAPRAAGGVEIAVIDTGAGMPADAVPRIFERFYKGAGSTGSGLGLTIARRLVEAHGGTIRAASAPGTGTTITLTLPGS